MSTTPSAPNQPLYDEGGVVVYHADCRDALPLILASDRYRFDLVLTDPPYGMDYQPQRDGRLSGPAQWQRGKKVTGDAVPFDPAPLLAFPRLVLFGAHWYADRLPPSGGWLVWDKTPKGPREGFLYSHCELAWTNLINRVLKYSFEWDGSSRNGEPFLHPTQKPVSLMRWIVEMFTKPGDTVLDPYMGSGPVAEACRQTGRNYVGIEVEEAYCRVAIDRLSQGLLFREIACFMCSGTGQDREYGQDVPGACTRCDGTGRLPWEGPSPWAGDNPPLLAPTGTGV